MKKMIWILILLICNITFAQTTNALTKFGKVITTEGLKQKLSIIASAEMEGRETGTPGQKKQLLILNQNLKEWAYSLVMAKVTSKCTLFTKMHWWKKISRCR